MTDWEHITDLLWQRAGGACERCGWMLAGRDRCARHHRLLRSAGGTHAVSNLLLLCHQCHGEVHARPVHSMDHGYIVSRYGNPPERTAVLHARYGWALLEADGGVVYDFAKKDEGRAWQTERSAPGAGEPRP